MAREKLQKLINRTIPEEGVVLVKREFRPEEPAGLYVYEPAKAIIILAGPETEPATQTDRKGEWRVYRLPPVEVFWSSTSGLTGAGLWVIPEEVFLEGIPDSRIEYTFQKRYFYEVDGLLSLKEGEPAHFVIFGDRTPGTHDFEVLGACAVFENGRLGEPIEFGDWEFYESTLRRIRRTVALTRYPSRPRMVFFSKPEGHPSRAWIGPKDKILRWVAGRWWLDDKPLRAEKARGLYLGIEREDGQISIWPLDPERGPEQIN